MAQHPDEKKKTDWNVSKIFPSVVAVVFSLWLSELYMNRLSVRWFTSAALTRPEIIGAAAPLSYRILAWIIVGLALFLFPIMLIDGFKRKPSKWLWIIACILAIPQLHGKTCLYENGCLITTTPIRTIRCEHALSEVTYAEIEVSGRISLRRRPDNPANLTMTLHIPCEKDEDVFTFSIESFRGKEENDRLYQMVRVRRLLPSSAIAVEPHTERALQQVIADEGLDDANPALIKELLKEPQ